MKRKCFGAGVFFLLSSSAFAVNTWNGGKGDGFVDDPAMWSEGWAPITNTVTASGSRMYVQIWPGADWVSTMCLREMAIFNSAFSLNFQPGWDNSFVLDGEGVRFVHGDIPAEMTARTVTYPFFCENGSGSRYRYLECSAGDSRHAAFCWSNAYIRLDHRQRTPGSKEYLDAENEVTFGRGYVLWGGTNEADVAGNVTVGGGDFSGYRNSMTITNDATVVMNSLDWQARVFETSFLLSGPQARLEILKHAYFGRTSSTTQPGTNVYLVADGATLRANSSAAATDDFYIGPKDTSPQVHRFVVTGAGSKLDYHDSNRGMGVNNGGVLEIADGGTVHVKSSLSTKLVAGNPGGVIRVAGEGSSLLFGNAGGTEEGLICIDGGPDSAFEQDGGEVKCLSTGGKLSVYLGQARVNEGVFKMSGGTFRMGDTAHGPFRVGECGSGTLEVSGGNILGLSGVLLAQKSSEGGVTTNVFRQTGGYIEGGQDGITIGQATDPNRNTSVELLGGVMVGKRIIGGGGVAPTATLYPKFYANGGTFRALDEGCYHKTYPFLYGFSALELGPKGLTLDVRSRCNVTQRFTNRAGETGRLFVTGSGTVCFDAPDGGDNAELVLGASAVCESALTNWQTRVVVANGANLSVADSTRLAFRELVLGDDASVGQLTVSPTTRLSLSALELKNLQISLSGTFAADTDYPVIAVKGELSAAEAFAWKSASVSGTKPTGCVIRLNVIYSPDDDRTTLSIRFETAEAPSVTNEWTGAAGGENVSWKNPDCWSAGVPDLRSIVTLSSDSSAVTANLTVDMCASLGALAFTALRDHVLAGDGSLYFEDCGVAAAISVAGGEQRIDVPVVAVNNLTVDVADGATLTFGEKLVSSTGSLTVNGSLTTGRVVLEGADSAFKKGVIHRGGILEATSAEVFGSAYAGGLFEFKGWAMLKVDGDPAEPAYRLPFGFQLHGGSADGTTWGSAKVLQNDRALVVPPYSTSMTGGGSLVKFGRGALAFETKKDVCVTMTVANGNNSWSNATLPSNAFKFNETTGKTEGTGYGGLNVHEGELVLRGADDIAPTATSQSIRNGFGTVIGYRATNTVSVTPGLVIDRVYADLGVTKTHANAKSEISYISLTQDALQTDFPPLATNAYLVVSNGSTLATGRLRVGAKTVSSDALLDVSPRIVVDGSTCRVVDGLDFAAQKKVHADWRIRNGSTLLTGTNGVVWAGEANVQVDNGSTLAGGDGTVAATFALGADASGTLAVTAGSSANLGAVTAADGADVTFAFDGGRLIGCADGGTIDFPDAVTLAAESDGLVLDIPDGETWNLAKDVTGPGFVMLNGAGSLALSGTVSAGFAGGGTVRGGTLVNGRIAADVTGASATPTFDGVTLSGRVKVDLGLGEAPQAKPYPTGVRVATFTGKVPPASAFRLVNGGVGESGLRLSGTFTVTDGVVTVDVEEKGLVLIVR